MATLWCPGPYARWTKTTNGPCRHYVPRKSSSTPTLPNKKNHGHKYTYPRDWLKKDGKLKKSISQKKLAEFRRSHRPNTERRARTTGRRARTTGGIDFYTNQFLKGKSEVHRLPRGLSKVSARDLYDSQHRPQRGQW